MTTSIQEMQWALRAQVGNREALELLLRSVLPSLRRYLAGLVGSADGDDLLQDVMVIIIRKLGSLQDPQVFRPWTFRIASREAFRHLTKTQETCCDARWTRSIVTGSDCWRDWCC